MLTRPATAGHRHTCPLDPAIQTLIPQRPFDHSTCWRRGGPADNSAPSLGLGRTAACAPSVRDHSLHGSQSHRQAERNRPTAQLPRTLLFRWVLDSWAWRERLGGWRDAAIRRRRSASTYLLPHVDHPSCYQCPFCRPSPLQRPGSLLHTRPRHPLSNDLSRTPAPSHPSRSDNGSGFTVIAFGKALSDFQIAIPLVRSRSRSRVREGRIETFPRTKDGLLKASLWRRLWSRSPASFLATLIFPLPATPDFDFIIRTLATET